MQPYFETPPKITVSVTATCNLDCKHCYADCSRAPRADEMTTAEWLKFFRYLVRNDFIQVYIEGGEPLFKEGFREILKYSGQRMMTMVRTNGTLLTPAIARDWKELRVGHVFVDIMGATAETHDYFTGVPGSFEKAIAGVRHLVQAGVRTDVVIIMNRRNVGELQAYLEMARTLGAGRVGVLRLYPLGRAKERWTELALALDEQDSAIAALRVPEGLGLMQSWHPRDANCCWQAAAVSPFGRSIGCVYLREYVDFGNIRETPFLETWHRDPLYLSLRSANVEKTCSGCHESQGSPGGCRSTAFAFHGRWTAPDPYCRNLNDGVDLRVLPQTSLRSRS